MKKKFATLLLGICLATLTACGSGQKVYYWEKPDTGAVWFARDHNQCLRAADWWPYYFPGYTITPPWGWGTPPEHKLRFDNNASHGIWAEFTPFPGAQPVYVNSLKGDWSMSYSTYERCMEDREYRQRKPATQNREVFQQ